MPLLVGDAYPAHYLLVVGHEDGRLLVYNPSGGHLIEVPATDLPGRATAFHHLHGVLLPPT